MSVAPEFSRLIEPAALVRAAQTVLDIEATPDERRTLARRLGLVGLEALHAHLVVRPWQKDGFVFEGRLTATLTQTCVVSLEPVAATLDEPVIGHFQPAATLAALPSVTESEDPSFDPEAPDPPEAMTADGRIDVGELVVQHLAVALDPYPRKPGVAFGPTGNAAPPEGAERPFAVLAQLQRKSGPEE